MRGLEQRRIQHSTGGKGPQSPASAGVRRINIIFLSSTLVGALVPVELKDISGLMPPVHWYAWTGLELSGGQGWFPVWLQGVGNLGIGISTLVSETES